MPRHAHHALNAIQRSTGRIHCRLHGRHLTRNGDGYQTARGKRLFEQAHVGCLKHGVCRFYGPDQPLGFYKTQCKHGLFLLAVIGR